MVDPISWELFRPGSSEDKIPRDTSVDDLNNDLPVGEPDNEAVLWCVAVEKSCQRLIPKLRPRSLFVLRLGDQAFASIV